MTSIENQNNLESALRVIPRNIRQRLLSATVSFADRVQEVVLRSERPVCVYVSGDQKCLSTAGCLTDYYDSSSLVIASSQDVAECFNNVCGYSVYSHLSEIKEGFITIKGGHRAGISGTAVVSAGAIANVRDISTISIRISRQIKGCAEKITWDLERSHSGLLVCGSPSSGKTTVIRDIARLLSGKYKHKVSMVDTRGELASVCNGVCQNDVGFCDVLDGYPRADGIEQAVRSLSPEYIICDEIGSDADVSALISGVNTGVCFVATMHAGSKEELLSRSNIKKILATGAFEEVVFLRGREHPGEIIKKYKKGELINA